MNAVWGLGRCLIHCAGEYPIQLIRPPLSFDGEGRNCRQPAKHEAKQSTRSSVVAAAARPKRDTFVTPYLMAFTVLQSPLFSGMWPIYKATCSSSQFIGFENYSPVQGACF